mmetsp:Transcript_10709/g.25537  ORF Transcript_10709/g.25537 Transcript_10709/m.25537 type:complete len:206 (+) Transcript_10709:442-1059(+)
MGVIPFVKPWTPSFFKIFVPPCIQPLGAKLGSATNLILRASIGQSMNDAANPATAPHNANESNCERNTAMDVVEANRERNERMTGLDTSYTPNFTAPSNRYPHAVGPSPAHKALTPSSWTMIRPAARNPLSANLGSTCFRVLMTSIGVGIACDTIAHIPPAKKYLQDPGSDTRKIVVKATTTNVAHPTIIDLSTTVNSSCFGSCC